MAVAILVGTGLSIRKPRSLSVTRADLRVLRALLVSLALRKWK